MFNYLSPAAIAVSVIRDGLRPRFTDEDAGDQDYEARAEFRELITYCWHQDPTVRPTFLVYQLVQSLLKMITHLMKPHYVCIGAND